MAASISPTSQACPRVAAQRRNRRPAASRATSVLLAAVALVAAACTGGTSAAPSASLPATAGPSAGQPASDAPSPTPGAPVRLVVGLGYIPSVQFAQFYLADQAGYYRDAGLEVEFQNKIDPELVTLVGQGAVDIGIADGTSVIPAVSQGIPIRYAFTVFAQFPSIVFAKASSAGSRRPPDLKGRKVGIPGKYGSSWIQLQALLAGAGLSTADLQLVLFPDYGQLAALQQGAVDAATGYANNEPVRLELSGREGDLSWLSRLRTSCPARA